MEERRRTPMSKVTSPAAGQAPGPCVVRELRLRRRRTKVPWIYQVYHVDPPAPGSRRKNRSDQPSCRRKKAGTSSGEGGSSAPPPPEAAREPFEGSSRTG